MPTTPDYTTWPALTDVQRRLSGANIAPRLTGDDLTTRYTEILNDLTTEIAMETQRQFIADQTDRTMIYDGTGTSEIEVDEMISLTSVQVIGIQANPGYALSDAQLTVEQGKPQTRITIARGSVPAFATSGVYTPIMWIFPSGRQNISVTGKFGFASTIPADLWAAVANEIAYQFAQEAIFTTTGRLAEEKQGDEMRKYALNTADVLNWHERYKKTVIFYKRPNGRKLRNLRPRMMD